MGGASYLTGCFKATRIGGKLLWKPTLAHCITAKAAHALPDTTFRQPGVTESSRWTDRFIFGAFNLAHHQPAGWDSFGYFGNHLDTNPVIPAISLASCFGMEEVHYGASAAAQINTRLNS